MAVKAVAGLQLVPADQRPGMQKRCRTGMRAYAIFLRLINESVSERERRKVTHGEREVK